MSDENPVDHDNTELFDTSELGTENATDPNSSRPSRLKIALIGVLAVVVVLGVFVAFLMVRSPLASSSADAEPAPAATRSSAPASATARPPMSPKPTTAPAVPPVVVQPAPPAPLAAPAPAAPAPVLPAPPAPPPLPAPPAPVIPPLAIKTMSASVSGECKDKSTIVLTWTTTGATADTASMRVRTGGGAPVFNQIWVGLSASGSNSFWLDCTRPIWFFDLTVTNGTESKLGRLTFANGKTAGWSWGNP